MKRFDLAIKFQYNSCYCLSISQAAERRSFRISIQLLLLFIKKRKCAAHASGNFNTTLVTVYRLLTGTPETVRRLFQYNSCYCLSNAFKPFFHFIIDSFPDKINVSLNFSQPSSIFSHFFPLHLQMAISRGFYVIINFTGWEISMTFST